MRIAIVLILSSFMAGCVTIKDYDAEKMEYEQIKNVKNAQRDPFKNKPTPDHVKVAEKDDVVIEVHKGLPLTGPEGIKLQVWHAMATNTAKESKCVLINWKLMDFMFESPLPTEFLLKGKEKLIIGKMRQTIWAFDDSFIALPPSGYVDSINIREPDKDKKTGKESCDLDETGIDEV